MMCAFMLAHMHACMHTHTHIHTQTHANTHTHTHTHTHHFLQRAPSPYLGLIRVELAMELFVDYKIGYCPLFQLKIS